jgi:hypothetical protein
MAALALALALAASGPVGDTIATSGPSGAVDHAALDDEGRASSAVATVFNEPYADAGDALEVCCAAAACTFIGINECSLLTPEGKVLAMMSAAVGGLGGFMGGVGLGIALWYAVDATVPAGTPLDPYKGGDLLLTLSFLSGAVGVVAGGIGGTAMAIAADVLFMQGPPPPTRYYYSREIPPDDTDDAPRVDAF